LRTMLRRLRKRRPRRLRNPKAMGRMDANRGMCTCPAL
jgi:hypothetical protein